MVDDNFIKALVGLAEKVAEDTIKNTQPLTFAIVRRGEEAYPTDMMYDENRIKLEIVGGVVEKATVG